MPPKVMHQTAHIRRGPTYAKPEVGTTPGVPKSMKHLLRYSSLPLLGLMAATMPVQAVWRDFDDAEAILGSTALPSPTRLYAPQGVTFHAASGKVFVCDMGNNRVLRFSSASALGTGQAAEAAFGQPDLLSGNPGIGQGKLDGPMEAAVDSAGRLWVSDVENHRILRWDNAVNAPSGTLAAQVLGAPDFNTKVGGMTQNRLARPGGLDFDSQGRLWVADYGNNRVLRFDNPAAKGNGGNADGVIGQPDFNTYSFGCTASSFGQAYDLDIDAQDRLWVADFDNARILRFDNPVTQGTANGVLCQPDFTSNANGGGPAESNRVIALSVSPAGTLYAIDTQNRRVLRWDNAAAKANGASADGVLGRDSLTSNANHSDNPGYVSNDSRGLATDAAGHLWLADRYFERVLRWDNAASKPNGAYADGVIGHAETDFGPWSYYNVRKTPSVSRGGVEDPVSGKFFVGDYGRVLRFASRADAEDGAWPEAMLGKESVWVSGYDDPSQTLLSSTWGVALDATGKLWVSDPESNRVLAFANAITAPTGSPAAVVLGQASFTDEAPGLAQNRMNKPRGLTLDAAGNLYVADHGNHRVLRFNNIASKTSGANADAVIGQANFTSVSLDADVALMKNPSAVFTDGEGKLWVADTARQRVLRYDAPLSAAPLAPPSGILGGTAAATPAGMSAPTGLVVDGAGRLFVLDRQFGRILRFDNAKAKPNGGNADGVLGSPSLNLYLADGRTRNTFSDACGLFLDATKNLWVGDEGNTRVMRFSPEASSVITQSGNSGANFSLTFYGEAGITYTVKSSTDLKTWQTEQSYPFASSGTQVFTKARNGVKRFYRVEEP